MLRWVRGVSECPVQGYKWEMVADRGILCTLALGSPSPREVNPTISADWQTTLHVWQGSAILVV